ncbi:MAG: hypothetical protein AAF934_01305 [Bacteroidota bacterium]
MIIVEELDEFKKDVKRLSKRYKFLKDDLETLKKVLRVYPDARPPFSFRIDGLGTSSCIIKVKKIACKSLKGKGVNTGLRLIYAYFVNEESKGNAKVICIELYHKSNAPKEDKQRILRYFD